MPCGPQGCSHLGQPAKGDGLGEQAQAGAAWSRRWPLISSHSVPKVGAGTGVAGAISTSHCSNKTSALAVLLAALSAQIPGGGL